MKIRERILQPLMTIPLWFSLFMTFCRDVANCLQVFWFHPDEPHSYSPNIMPQFPCSYQVEFSFLVKMTCSDFRFILMENNIIPSFFVKFKMPTNQFSLLSYITVTTYQLMASGNSM